MESIKNTLYAKYIKERENQDVLENETGFITYLIKEKECFIGSMFIETNDRCRGKGRVLVQELTEIALAAGCEFISATVQVSDKNCSKTLLASMIVGFQIARAEANTILIFKDIKGDL